MELNIGDWVPAFSTAGIFGAIVWLSRNAIRTYIEKRLEHQFDQKIENIRSQIRTAEESIKSELRSNEGQIASLRESGLSGLSDRRAISDSRRLLATDNLWSAFVDLGPAITVAAYVSVLKFDQTSDLAAKDQRVREMIGIFSIEPDIVGTAFSKAKREKPFVSPIVWALFEAYFSIASMAVAKLESLKIGIADAGKLFNEDVIKDLVVVVLPDKKELIQNSEPNYVYSLLGEIEQKLVIEIKKSLGLLESDEAGLDRAGEILKYAAAVQEDVASFNSNRQDLASKSRT